MLEWIKKDVGGREIIKTDVKLTGNIKNDLDNIKKILKNSMKIHKKNQAKMDELYSIFFGATSIKNKDKTQRCDINNKISVNQPFSIVRTINSYCFGEPFKYLASNISKQKDVEVFNEIMNYANNYENTIDATLNSAIAGLGYKIALPTSDDEVPFKINGDIDPRSAFCVYSDEIIPECIMGVYIQNNYNKEGTKIGNKYTIWTKYYQLFLKDSNDNKSEYDVIQQIYNGENVDVYPSTIALVPLVEIPRNKFRLGDYELVIPLLDAKNQLLSNRVDDIQQLVDYLLVLTNCVFENENDKKSALSSRLLLLKSVDPNNKPSAEILKNSLDQNGTQLLAEYIDALIQEIVGIPSRQEKSSGGDTGQAARFRNGFRDLENNAGLIVPKMESAEKLFSKICLKYCKNISSNELSKENSLLAREIKIVFKRTLTDDPVASSSAFYNFVKGGMAATDALIASKSVSDPAEVGSRCQVMNINGSTSSSSSSEDNKSPETSNNEQG